MPFTYEKSFGTAAQLPPPDLPEVAFAGRSNVGKSSLINALLSRKHLARVSATPGKTITVNFFTNGQYRIVDLPGYGYAKRSKAELERFSNLMEGYFSQPGRPSLSVLLLDMRHKLSKDDIVMLQFLQNTGRPFVAALTKADKLNKTQTVIQTDYFSNILTDFGAMAVFTTAAQKHLGTSELMGFIHQFMAQFSAEES
ncbi:MAG: ribosome biogenesis GTP-binding protein YihA/YsxC [Oscillospiraceae bacterium]|nr:ribosome biogenesis GTP-binding protein YihA/YsxC [Oscillospiraceae bacterium]